MLAKALLSFADVYFNALYCVTMYEPTTAMRAYLLSMQATLALGIHT